MEAKDIEILAETDDFSAWRMVDPDGEMLYHIEFGPVTIHLFQEDWVQFVELASQLSGLEGDTFA